MCFCIVYLSNIMGFVSEGICFLLGFTIHRLQQVITIHDCNRIPHYEDSATIDALHAQDRLTDVGRLNRGRPAQLVRVARFKAEIVAASMKSAPPAPAAAPMATEKCLHTDACRILGS